MQQTTPYHHNGTFLVPAITFTMLLGVGTGGDYTCEYHALRESRIAFNKPRDSSSSTMSAVAADLDYVKSTLKLTMTELAKCLGVSRQASYNWMAGSPIKAENVAKLNNLKSAADIIAAEKLPAHSLLLQRKLPGGKTLVEAISSGADGARVAQSLIAIMKKEADQRRFLSGHFAGRVAPKNNALVHSSFLPPLDET